MEQSSIPKWPSGQLATEQRMFSAPFNPRSKSHSRQGDHYVKRRPPLTRWVCIWQHNTKLKCISNKKNVTPSWRGVSRIWLPVPPQPHKLAVVQHTNFQNTMVLARTTGYMDHLVETDINNTMVLVRTGGMDHLVKTDISNTMVLVRTTGYKDHLVKRDINNTMVLARTTGYMDHLVKRDIKNQPHLDKFHGHMTCSKLYLVTGHQPATIRQGQHTPTSIFQCQFRVLRVTLYCCTLKMALQSLESSWTT